MGERMGGVWGGAGSGAGGGGGGAAGHRNRPQNCGFGFGVGWGGEAMPRTSFKCRGRLGYCRIQKPGFMVGCITFPTTEP